ncbi:MAG: acyltransferase family protein [Bacteroidaceae bacterium]|nr:acyltransferase family protein [Bacteroidaceae bacterium]
MEQKVITNRLDWMDWAKAIAITIVVFGHIYMPFSKWIFGFHMPFFFMLSGFLQKKRSVRDEAVNSAKSLLIPYVIYNVYLLIYSLFTGEYASNYPLDMLLGMQWNLSMACRPLWFLLSLFFMRMAYAALSQKGSCVLAVLCIVFVLVFHGAAPMKPQMNYFQIFEAVICFPFFVIGILMHQYKVEQVLDHLPVALRYVCIAIGLAVGFYFVSINGGVIPFRLMLSNVPLFYLGAIFISISLIWLIYQTLKVRNAYIQLLSEGTLLIFAVHQSICWPLRSFVPSGTWGALAFTMVTVIALSGFVWLARKYCPVLLGKMK